MSIVLAWAIVGFIVTALIGAVYAAIVGAAGSEHPTIDRLGGAYFSMLLAVGAVGLFVLLVWTPVFTLTNHYLGTEVPVIQFK